jgi:hypothetical protein
MRNESVEAGDGIDRSPAAAFSPCQLNSCDQRVGSQQEIDAGRNNALQNCGEF